jgi:hypothetical protein
MVRFEDEKLVIEISTHNRRDSVETWIALQKELLFLMRWIEDGCVGKDFYLMPDLLEELLPDFEQASKMIE